MRQLLPRTLKTRAIAVIFTVFILSQVASLLLFEQNRDKAVILTETADLADRIIGIVNLAHRLPEKDRQQILAAAETQFLTTYPDIVSIEQVACQANEFSNRLASRLDAAFRQIPGIHANVCVRNLDRPQFFKTDASPRGFDVLVFIDFPDDEQRVFHTILPASTSLLEDSVLIYIGIVCAISLLMGWYLINKAIAPLEDLARAADEIGTNIDKPPMSEQGPREVATAAQAFNRMQSRLSRLISAQTEMLAAISHDLRSAVTRLQLRVDMLPESAEREGLERVVADMRLMVQSVLDFVRGYDPQEELRNVNITALVESLCADMAEEGFPVECHCETDGMNISCRPTGFRRGLQNLIDNAIRYGNSARVYVARARHTVLIRIDDDGPGIPEEKLDSVLQPFYRLDRNRGDTSAGIGLGLSITLNIVQSLGGSLKLVNRASGGLSAEMQIPLAVPRAEKTNGGSGPH